MVEISYRKLIIREINGETSHEESQQLDLWINESQKNREIYNELWSAYQLTSPDVDLLVPDKDVAWARIVSEISAPGISFYSRIIQFSKFAAAALIFILIGIAFQYLTTEKIPTDFLNQYSTLIVPEGQKSMIVLPDGSKVWLNSGSSLKYKNSFNSNIREVALEGEAFFDVAKDKSRMFRVNTGDLTVEVYGTAFDVKNYGEERNVEVTVDNGNVGIFRKSDRIAELTRGKQVEINKKSNEALVGEVKVDEVTAWKNNELIFDDSPFEEVIRYLERWYGVNITIEEKMKRKHNYTFKVKTETLTELLKLLKVITPLDYKIDGKEVTIRYAR